MSGLVLSLFPGIGLLDMAFEQEGFCVVRGPDVLWGGDIRSFHPPAGKFDGVIGGPPCQAFSSLVHLVHAAGREPKFGNLIPEFERCVAEAAPAWFVMEEVRGAPVPLIEGYGIKDFLWCNSWVCGEDGYGQEQMRTRRITFGVRDSEPVSLRRWMTPCALLLPDAVRRTPDNSPESRVRLTAVTGAHGGEGRCRRSAVLSSLEETPVAIGGSGKRKPTARVPAVTSSDGGNGGGMGMMRRYRFADACRLQGLSEDFLSDAPFTAEGKLKAVANGVPIPIGRAIARAVKKAIEEKAT